MKADIHPNYKVVTVQCACGETFQTGTTKNVDVLKVDICSNAIRILRASKSWLTPAVVSTNSRKDIVYNFNFISDNTNCALWLT